jgi:hypothetical protein
VFPVCSFCGDRPVIAWFEGPDFKASLASPEEVHSDEAWLACSSCALLVEAEDRDGLARRGVKRLRRAPDSERALTIVRGHYDRLFWAPRTSG